MEILYHGADGSGNGRRGRRAIEILVTVLLLGLIVALVVSMLRLGRRDYQGLALSMAKRERKHFEVLKPCPLCSELLRRGETVKSKVIEIAAGRPGDRFAGNRLGVKETIAHLFGCPHCWPSNAEHPRVCPYCKARLGKDDYVVARYFEKEQGRNHLHVLGCTICRKP